MRVLDLASDVGDLVLDFHLGSGTTAAVAMKMGRRFIGIEQLDYGVNDSVTRLNNVVAGDLTGVSRATKWQGGGEFVSCELCQANQRFLDRIQSTTSHVDLDVVWQEMQERAFLSYHVDVRSIDPSANDWQVLSLDDKKRLLMETLDKNMLYVPLSEMDDTTWGVSEADKALNRGFFGV